MKVALLTDLHFGARNDSLVFHQFFQKFYSECFFPYIDKHGIDTIILGGDTFDRRKYINFLSLHYCKGYFFDQIDKRNIRLIINIGNHDVFYKNTNSVNSPELLFMDRYELVASVPKVVRLGSLDLLIVPWITQDNYDICMHEIATTKAQVMYGHLELAGFEMSKGHIIEHGMSADPFDKFDLVLTGHYHHRSSRSNIRYLGCPYEITWADYDDPHGFHILDTETRELEFIENPFRIFHKLWYDDREAKKPDDAIKNIDYSQYYGCYIKVIVSVKTKPAWFDIIIDKLEKAGAADLQVVDDHLNLDLEPDDNIINEAEDTTTLLRKYVQAMDGLPVDKVKLEDMMLRLYNEAIWVAERE